MMEPRRIALAAALLAALGGSSCNPFRRHAPGTPAAPASAKPPIVIPEPAKANPPQIPPPDVAGSQTTDIKNVPPAQIPGTKPGPLPRPPRRQPSTRKPAAGPAAPEAPAAAQNENVPQLRPILTPEQRQQLGDSVTQRLDHAQRTLRAIESRKLNRQQAAAAQQIRTFIHQAQDARASDLIRANNLAERAEVLAIDLLKSMP